MKPRIVALDLGSATGYAFGCDGKVLGYGVCQFRPGRFEGGGMRFVRFSKFLEDSYEANKPDVVYFEEVRRHLGVDAAHLYGGFLAVLSQWAEAHSVPYSGVPVGTIKRHATGKGNADKQAMIDAMAAKGFPRLDDNAADALALLHWAFDQ